MMACVFVSYQVVLPLLLVLILLSSFSALPCLVMSWTEIGLSRFWRMYYRDKMDPDCLGKGQTYLSLRRFNQEIRNSLVLGTYTWA